MSISLMENQNVREGLERREVSLSSATIVRDFAYECMCTGHVRGKEKWEERGVERGVEREGKDEERKGEREGEKGPPHTHPLRSCPEARSRFGLFPYRDRSVTLTTPEGDRITWIPRAQVVPASVQSSPVQLRGSAAATASKKKKERCKKREVCVERFKKWFRGRERKKKEMQGTKGHATGMKPSVSFLRKLKSVFDWNEKERDEEIVRRRLDVDECRLCREDGVKMHHENHRISPPSSEFSNRNGEALNPLAGRKIQYERFVHERAEGMMKSSKSERSGEIPLRENRRRGLELPEGGSGSMEIVAVDDEARNGDGKVSTAEQILTWPAIYGGRSKDQNQQARGLDGAVGSERGFSVDVEDDLVNVTFTPLGEDSMSSPSTLTSSEIWRLLSLFPILPQHFDEMEEISKLELPVPAYPKAYSGLREGQKEALYAKDWPLPTLSASSTCESFQFESRATIKDALNRWSMEATNRSTVDGGGGETELEEQILEEAMLGSSSVPPLRASPVMELKHKIQEAMETPLIGIAIPIPRPNSVEIDKRRKEMKLQLRRPSFTESVASTSSDFTSEPPRSLMIEKLDNGDSNTQEQDIIVGSPFVDVHEQYVSNPSASFPKSLSPIGYPALDSSATLSEFGFHPTLDTMPGSWKQRWEMIYDESSEEGGKQVAAGSLSDAATTPEEQRPFVLDDDIKRSEPIPIKSCARQSNVRRSESQLMFSKCRRIPGSFVDDDNSESNVSTF